MNDSISPAKSRTSRLGRTRIRATARATTRQFSWKSVADRYATVAHRVIDQGTHA